jgi:predicted metalloprotease
MDLGNAPESSNVRDSRGMGSKVAIGGGLGGVILVVLGLIFGPEFLQNLPQVADQTPHQRTASDEKTLVFTKKVLGTTEVVWKEQFQKMGKRYEPPELELFSKQVQTGCGLAPSAVGPFYCPKDRTVYLDPTFFDELERKLGGSKGEFSQAYVIAHEVAHHVQHLLGYMDRRGTRDENDFSVRLELQADYLAGVWAHHGQKTFRFIEPGDVESAIKSANAIGDDRLQRRSGGFVHPEKFTHGTSEQRVRWFTKGLRSGDASLPALDHFFRVASSREL